MSEREQEAAIPSCTYRLQLNRSFTLQDARALVSYLAELGVGSVYVSPILAAREGSMHGYDVIDHSILNPELGTGDDLAALSEELRKVGMGLVVDVVPNHMCIADHRNWRFYDVLENGPSSPQARFFDIDWQPPREDLANKVLLPVLGDQYGRILENQQIRLDYVDGAFIACYWEKHYPIAPRAWTHILERILSIIRQGADESDPHVAELESIITAINYLPLRTETDESRIRERLREKTVVRTRFSRLLEEAPEARQALEETLKEINGRSGDPSSFDLLETLLADQAYRLSSWRVAADEINYRRFFDINELAAIRVEDPLVFVEVHAALLEYIQRGWVTGLRIDHPDGLFDPVRYFRDLQQACWFAVSGDQSVLAESSRPFYIVAEKIIVGDERARRTWAVHGTTGYDFLHDLNGVMVDTTAEAAFEELYSRFTGSRASFHDLVYECKRLILRVSMSSELNVLSRRLDRICQQHRHTRDFTLESLRFALREIISCFPVYRTYIREEQDVVDQEDRRHILAAIDEARQRNPATSQSIFDVVGSIMLLEDPPGIMAEQKAERRLFVMRLQQLTGPVMAKGVEDTAFYRRYPLASLNEVGGDPVEFGVSSETFHRRISARWKHWPHNMLATSTHDTKRSEDVRARLNVLSEIPGEWADAVTRWRAMNASMKTGIPGLRAPEPNAEYLLYQTLAGAWPLENIGSAGDPVPETTVHRIQNYMEKALREAKIHTSWINPNPAYDEAVRDFVARILEIRSGNDFPDDMRAFAGSIAYPGLLNALSQVLLKIACPGVPDIYQGTELWDFSLVDPDNRRPIDYDVRRRLLFGFTDIQSACRNECIREMLMNLFDSRLKLFVLQALLRFRRDHQHLFLQSDYQPLGIFGDQKNHVISFSRSSADGTMIAAAGRFFLRLGCRTTPPVGEAVWQDSAIVLPRQFASQSFRDVLSGREVRPSTYRGRTLLPLSEVFSDLPVALLATGLEGYNPLQS